MLYTFLYYNAAMPISSLSHKCKSMLSIKNKTVTILSAFLTERRTMSWKNVFYYFKYTLGIKSFDLTQLN